MTAPQSSLPLRDGISEGSQREGADWRDDALCAQVDTDTFFPDRGGGVANAKRICALCDVQTECLQYALDNPVDGVWGGTSVRDRRALARAAGRGYNTVVTPRLAGPQERAS